ncbi:MmcQ/YjbR family DNA-binding protein [Lacihabitans sp. LS3-19]|uniref:MmcQ/YjbR family DNA-binding protein n=1 Tax=Lacihabitans sp. LS3-19 TaxID=2487335 RepID=UPI0020CDD98F|nr:MmcQ/YjbR family DNA-binding protein [Lacihabitans sp. LS3-19]MCP9769794.1 MmcQ/YjbR family DNA-binding protein [Lacihabitans sp. LS3-19]
MNIEDIRNYCLSFKGVTEEMTFGPTTVVFKVMGKMFLLLPLDTENLVLSVKNTPEKNIDLRARNNNIVGAYHMNKVHWNNLFIDFTTKNDLVRELISESYELVKKGLTKKLQADLEGFE